MLPLKKKPEYTLEPGEFTVETTKTGEVTQTDDPFGRPPGLPYYRVVITVTRGSHEGSLLQLSHDALYGKAPWLDRPIVVRLGESWEVRLRQQREDKRGRTWWVFWPTWEIFSGR